MSQFEEVANKLSSVDQKGLSEVSKLCQRQVQLQEKVELLEQEIKDTKKELREVAEDQLPAAMAEHNLSKIELESGS
jgi:archaellum component FlaC